MNASFGPTKELKQFYSNPPPGHFALEPDPSKTIHWDHCREQFAAKFNEKTEGFYFSHPENKGENVANFLIKFEDIIELEVFSTFSKTNKDTILWIDIAPFWLNCFMKRSLLTILLRCGINYDSDFDEALFGTQFKESIYTIETKPAIMRFMFGFTKFTGQEVSGAFQSVIKHGWKEEFQKLDNFTIRNKLVSPNKEKETTFLVIDSLWT